MLRYLSLNTRYFSNQGGIASDSELRNNQEYQELAGVQGEGLYYSRMITKPSDTKCVVQNTLKWLPMSGVEGHSTHWRLLVLFSIKYGQSNAQFKSGVFCSWRLYSSRNGFEDGLEGDRQKRMNSFRNVDRNWFRTTYFACFVCLK